MSKTELTKDERIREEAKKINSLFIKIDAKTKKAIQSLITNAAFMAVTLADLQKQMNDNGVISEYKNGENQFGTKKSPEVEIYTSMIEKYMKAIKQLTDLLPKQIAPANDDGFDKFVNGR